jgi:hypothetical protein
VHSIAITFGPTSTLWVLTFKTKESAEAAYDKIFDCIERSESTSVSVKDDFGYRVYVPVAEINGVLFEDMDQTRLVHIERNLHQMRTQLKVQQIAQADPALKLANIQMHPGPFSVPGVRPS